MGQFLVDACKETTLEVFDEEGQLALAITISRCWVSQIHRG
jgi:hypothetical protein